MEATVVDSGNGTETGHIIVTTIGGRNGQPKQVYPLNLEEINSLWFEIVQILHRLNCFMLLFVCKCVPEVVVVVLN